MFGVLRALRRSALRGQSLRGTRTGEPGLGARLSTATAPRISTLSPTSPTCLRSSPHEALPELKGQAQPGTHAAEQTRRRASRQVTQIRSFLRRRNSAAAQLSQTHPARRLATGFINEYDEPHKGLGQGQGRILDPTSSGWGAGPVHIRGAYPRPPPCWCRASQPGGDLGVGPTELSSEHVDPNLAGVVRPAGCIAWSIELCAGQDSSGGAAVSAASP